MWPEMWLYVDARVLSLAINEEVIERPSDFQRFLSSRPSTTYTITSLISNSKCLLKTRRKVNLLLFLQHDVRTPNLGL